MKGVILSINPEARIVDLTHETPPQDIQAAAFNLLSVYKDFPPSTIHVAVVDPGVGSSRRAIVIECAEQLFLGPDNGTFSWICEREGDWRAFQLTNDKFFRHPVSATFHGRDVFAPSAAALSTGTVAAEFGPAIGDLAQLESLATRKRGDGAIEARVIHVDRFGNCITNLTAADLGENTERARVVVNEREVRSFRRFFADGPDDGEVFCVVGSAGFLEIAAPNASAATILNVERGQPITLFTQGGG